MRYAPVSRQICVPGSDAEPLRNSLIRRGNSIRNRDKRYGVLLWIRRLKVRILPPQPPPVEVRLKDDKGLRLMVSQPLRRANTSEYHRGVRRIRDEIDARVQK